MSASVPDGPESGRSAEPPTIVISPPPFAGLGSILRAALRSGSVCELCQSIVATYSDLLFWDTKSSDTKEKIPALAETGTPSTTTANTAKIRFTL